MDGLDITPLLVLLKSINPTYAAIALAVWVIVQKVRSQGGLKLGQGGLLAILNQLLGKHTPSDAPAKPADPVKPKDESDTLLDILAKRLRDRLKLTAKAAGDDHAAVELYAQIVKLLDKNGNGQIDPDEMLGIKVDK